MIGILGVQTENLSLFKRNLPAVVVGAMLGLRGNPHLWGHQINLLFSNVKWRVNLQ